VRPEDSLTSWLSEWLLEQIFGHNKIMLGGTVYRVASTEDYVEWYGNDDDSGPALLIREDDGSAYEVEVEVDVSPLARPAQADDLPPECPGQEALPLNVGGAA